MAKGDHQDRDDFYQRVERENGLGDPTKWLPGPEDRRLLGQETAARLRTEWELRSQESVFRALQDVHQGGTRRIQIAHPVPDVGRFATVDLTVTAVREDGYDADEILVEVIPEKQYAGTELFWQLTVRVLISIEPPEQSWDRFGNTYTNIGEPGAWTARLTRLHSLVSVGELESSVPGSASHYAHRLHLAGKTINGEAVRALCGVYFVPTQDHDALPTCLVCEERLAELPD